MKKKEEAARTGKVIRTTMETVVDVQLNIDGEGTADIDTGIGFFDHMLNLLASHGRFDLKVKADGDLEVDGHHTVEDVGIALGQAMMDAAGSKKGIARYGSFFLPMDETLALVSLDFSGRPLLVYDAGGPMTPMIGDYDTELTEEFLRAIDQAVEDENRRWGADQPPVKAEVEVKGIRPAGTQSPDCPIVTAAFEAARMLGIQPELRHESSTDANIPISMGIPAIAVGRGGRESGIHTTREWFEPVEAWLGPQRDLLLVLLLAGLEGVTEPVIQKKR